MNEEEPGAGMFYLVLFCIVLIAILIKIIVYIINVHDFKY